ncbi:putative transmembrane protein [Senna tora]|uniref:Putative transmembrane protein n=1 Tax=Senna tora TaxID=362788 RepID=A0A834WW84_9FABA|nr:putative transmembrane protein [Senna tora]
MGRVLVREGGGLGEDEYFGGALSLFSIILLSLSVISVIIFSCGIDDDDDYSRKRSRRSSTRRSSGRGIDGGRVGENTGDGGGCGGGGG